MPYVLYQVWAFVAPGPVPAREALRRAAAGVLHRAVLRGRARSPTSSIFPLIFRFFVATTPHDVQLMADINNYLSFTMHLFVAFGVAFETPVAVVLLVLTKLVSLQKLRKARGYVLIIVFVVAAALTPPDVLSQTSMAVPMYLLYEGGLFFAAIMSKKAAATTAAEAS